MLTKTYLPLLFLFVVSCNNGSKIDLEKETKRVDSLAGLQNNNTNKIDMYEFDSLKKYSYEVIFMRNGKIDGIENGGATAFFVSFKNKLFLVSNYHVFTASNTVTKTRYPANKSYDTLALRYKKYGSDKFFYDTIDLTKIKKDNPPISFFENAEVYIYPIKKPKEAIIYSIENMIDTTPLKKLNPKNIIAFGYPKEDPEPQGYLFSSFSYIYEPYVNITDPETNKSRQLYNSYLVTQACKPGMSGSPVFLKYDTVDGTFHYSKIVFGGIMHGNSGTQYTYIVKPSVFIDMLIRR